MTYSTIAAIVQSGSFKQRLIAAAAAEGIASPEVWVEQRLWKFAVQPGWADAWSYASDTVSINDQPDIGVRTDVITDGQILSAIQAVSLG